MGKLISEKKLVRAHGLREKDQVNRDDIWWIVERQCTPGGTVVLRGKDADKQVNVPAEGVSVIAARGSRREVLTFKPNTLLNVIRQREKVGS